MTQEQFDALVKELVEIVKAETPKDGMRTKNHRPTSGNLRYNAVKFEYKGNNKVEIYVDENQAPYMPYTNEPWISPKWNGKQNPNEEWWQNTVEKLVQHIVSKYGGKVK